MKRIWLLFAVLLLLGCVGCSGKKDDPKEDVVVSHEKLQIGMSFDSFVIERWLRDRDQFELTARDLGAEVNVQVANGDVNKQISQIQYFIRKGMDVIVVIAVDGASLKDVVKEAQNAGIRVVCYDRLLTDSGTDLYISFDNEKVGALMGEALKQALPDGGNIFTIHGSPADNNVKMVEKGLTETIEDSSLKVIYKEYCENWLAELAFSAIEDGLDSTTRNIVGVMCGNDDLASQAFRALAENRLAGKVILVGQDAELSACQRIVEGTQYMTVYKPVEVLAHKAAQFACAIGYQKLLEEKRITEDQLPADYEAIQSEYTKLGTINDGSADVPYLALEPLAVTADNMDELIIDSGFHSAEDVYLNVNQQKNGMQ